MKFIKVIFFLCCLIISNKLCTAGIDALAVVPFKVIGDIKNPDIYGYGLPDAIANNIAKIPGITVVERLRLSAVIQELKLSQAGFINEKDAAKLGELLAAKTIIFGTVQKLGKQVRIHARAVNSISGKIVFSVKVQKKINSFQDIFKLQDITAQKIIFQLGRKITEQQLDEIEDHATASEQAFGFYSTGLKFIDRGDYHKGLKHFQKAAEIDKNFDWAKRVRLRAKAAFKELEREIQH